MKTLGIDHVVIAVRDIEKAAKFFSELFETSFEDLEPPDGVEVRTKICTEGIELITPLTAQNAVAKFLDDKGEGLYGISFRVVNAQEAADDVTEKRDSYYRKSRERETWKLGLEFSRIIFASKGRPRGSYPINAV